MCHIPSNDHPTPPLVHTGRKLRCASPIKPYNAVPADLNRDQQDGLVPISLTETQRRKCGTRPAQFTPQVPPLIFNPFPHLTFSQFYGQRKSMYVYTVSTLRHSIHGLSAFRHAAHNAHCVNLPSPAPTPHTHYPHTFSPPISPRLSGETDRSLITHRTVESITDLRVRTSDGREHTAADPGDPAPVTTCFLGPVARIGTHVDSN